MTVSSISSSASSLLQPTQATSPLPHHRHRGNAVQTDPFAALLGKTGNAAATGTSSTAAKPQSSGAASMFDLLV
jgi:hypothetical protein